MVCPIQSALHIFASLIIISTPTLNSFTTPCSRILLTKDSLENSKLTFHILQMFVSFYQPSQNNVKNLIHILKRLRKNKNIVILKPDKGNGVFMLDRMTHNSKAPFCLKLPHPCVLIDSGDMYANSIRKITSILTFILT